METQINYNTISFYMFLEHIFVFCVKYKVFSVYCTLSQTEKSSVYKEDFDIKFDLIGQKPFFYSLTLKFNLIQLGLYVYNLFFAVLVTFLLTYAKAYFILWTIYIRLCWLHVHNQQHNNMLGHKKIKS